MINIGGYRASNIEEGVILDRKIRVTADLFKVLIPRITSQVKITTPKESTVKVSKDRCVNAQVPVNNYKIRNYLEAENITSLTIKHRGNVTSMKSSEGISETETIARVKVKLIHSKGGPHPPHEHVIKKPMKFKDMTYEDLNKKYATTGTKCICVFVGGNPSNVKVLYIPDIIERGE